MRDDVMRDDVRREVDFANGPVPLGRQSDGRVRNESIQYDPAAHHRCLCPEVRPSP